MQNHNNVTPILYIRSFHISELMIYCHLSFLVNLCRNAFLIINTDDNL